MKSIKTYEGFLDLFKRKPKNTEPVYMDDIKECGYDLLHDNRISTYVDGRTPGGIGHDFDDIFVVCIHLVFTKLARKDKGAI